MAEKEPHPTSLYRLWPFIEKNQLVVLVNGPHTRVFRAKPGADDLVEEPRHKVEVTYAKPPAPPLTVQSVRVTQIKDPLPLDDQSSAASEQEGERNGRPKPCPEHHWMGRVAGSESPCPHCSEQPDAPTDPPVLTCDCCGSDSSDTITYSDGSVVCLACISEAHKAEAMEPTGLLGDLPLFHASVARLLRGHDRAEPWRQVPGPLLRYDEGAYGMTCGVCREVIGVYGDCGCISVRP